MDVGPKTVELFSKELEGAHTVVWNGPMGVFEFSNFAQGTIGVCKAIANLKTLLQLSVVVTQQLCNFFRF